MKKYIYSLFLFSTLSYQDAYASSLLILRRTEPLIKIEKNTSISVKINSPNVSGYSIELVQALQRRGVSTILSATAKDIAVRNQNSDPRNSSKYTLAVTYIGDQYDSIKDMHYKRAKVDVSLSKTGQLISTENIFIDNVSPKSNSQADDLKVHNNNSAIGFVENLIDGRVTNNAYFEIGYDGSCDLAEKLFYFIESDEKNLAIEEFNDKNETCSKNNKEQIDKMIFVYLYREKGLDFAKKYLTKLKNISELDKESLLNIANSK